MKKFRNSITYIFKYEKLRAIIILKKKLANSKEIKKKDISKYANRF